MKKRVLFVSLVICLIFSLYCMPATASQSMPDTTAEQTVRALGIINGDANGNMNLSSNVTRAEFVKMVVAASAYKDNAGDYTNMLLYKDIAQNHWAVGYIKVAVDNGWLLGYADGTFRPNNPITLQEAASVLLRMLGYKSDDLSGLFSGAQINKFKALGLNDGVNATQSQNLTRSDCVTIFYNLLNADTADGSVYATTLGYTLNSNGKIDYTALITANMKGPFVLQSGANLTSLLPFSTTNISVYKNGNTAVLSAAAAFDVCYYNTNLRTVWLFDRKVTGTYTAVSPSSAAPATVSVAGNNYVIGTSLASYKLSSMGVFSIGDIVTLLRGMDGNVVDVYSADDVNCTYYGVVTSSQTSSYTDSDGKTVSEKTVNVACTDGVERQYPGSLAEGKLVSVSNTGDGINVTHLGSKSISGNIDSSGTKLGNLSFADDVEILDTNATGDFIRIYPSRLAGVSLTNGDVLYYVLDEYGNISHLILNNVTGDLYSYGLLTDVKEYSNEMTSRGYYEFIINGTPGALNSTNTAYNVSVGGACFHYNDGTIFSIRNLKSMRIDSVSNLYAMSSNQKYLLSENLQVYTKINGSYYQANISTVSDTSKYDLKCYYDDFGYSAGGLVRIIVATAKS